MFLKFFISDAASARQFVSPRINICKHTTHCFILKTQRSHCFLNRRNPTWLSNHQAGRSHPMRIRQPLAIRQIYFAANASKNTSAKNSSINILKWNIRILKLFTLVPFAKMLSKILMPLKIIAAVIMITNLGNIFRSMYSFIYPVLGMPYSHWLRVVKTLTHNSHKKIVFVIQVVKQLTWHCHYQKPLFIYLLFQESQAMLLPCAEIKSLKSIHTEIHWHLKKIHIYVFFDMPK